MAEVALICGASGALGQSLVAAFLERGDRVVAVERQPQDNPPSGVTSEAVDLTVADQVEALWERLEERGERPRWVVNAVGGFRGGTVAKTEPDSVSRSSSTSTSRRRWWSCRAAARRLETGAAIVNVASRSAVLGGSGAAVYSVAKAAVVRLTAGARRGARRAATSASTPILPSVIDTPANRAAMSGDAMREAVPPAQIAAVVAFLCSDAATAVSGAAIPVYGDA